MRNTIRWVKRQWYKIFYYSPYWESAYGKFRVLYKDGAKSVPMCYKNAKSYAEIFNGKVIDNF